ncbi:hypothetical protein FO519_008586 [Halicephalobus sp. NKZ332]|nr:hypothetical protein FO519_008586 [Halicephalobus sp. NKZ332]
MKRIVFLGIILISFVQSSFATFVQSTCGSSKLCLFKPSGCTPYVNCSYAMSYQADDSNVYLEIFGQVQASSSVWVAIGFSTDTIMGRDSVVLCADLEGTGKFNGSLAYNPGKSNRPVSMAEDVENEMIKTVTSGYTNGTLYCLLERKIAPISGVNTDQVFDLSNPYYILMASGKIEYEQTMVHNMDPSNNLFPYISPNPVNLLQMKSKRSESDILSGYQLRLEPSPEHLASVGLQERQFPQQQQPFTQSPQFQPQTSQPQGPQGPQGSVKYKADLLKVHAILMVIAWIFFLPNGILVGAFFKRHWPNTYIFGGNIWFQFHRVFNIIGIACTIAAFVCIFVREEWIWVGPSPTKTTQENQSWGSVHAILGLLACVVAWAQPLNAVFRCHPASMFRFIYNLIHGFFGLGALLMAFAAIMIAAVHFKTAFTNSDAVEGIFIAFLCVFGVCFIILLLLSLGHWYKSRRNVTAVDMELVQSNGKRHVTLAPETIRTHRIMNVVYLFFFAVSVGATVAIAILIGLVKVQ